MSNHKPNPYLQHRETHSGANGIEITKSGSAGAALNPLTARPLSKRYFDILKTRRQLPVYDFREKLMTAVKDNVMVVLVGETGSGKTTQVPQFLVEAGYGTVGGMSIACTQPRRVAAMSVSKRVAEEMDVVLGEEVGYTIRFEDKTSQRTVLKYCTDGMLLREAMFDPELQKYGCIVLDEAHERTLSTDLLMGLLKDLALQRKPPLKLVVMSATLDSDKFVKYFNSAPLLEVPGRVFPVEIFYLPKPAADYVDFAVNTAVHIHRTEGPGDVLVFLTGEDEIEDACRRVQDELYGTEESLGPLRVLPLYANLPIDKQQRVFDRAPPAVAPNAPAGRKIIFATNIAETSLTIDGVVFVIDSGFSKQKTYNPRVRSEALQVTPISQASAKQRAGRAGRTRPGKCFRLYTEKAFKSDLLETTYPEILRSNIGNLALQMLTLGVSNLVKFDYMDPPAPDTLMRALEQLQYLGAITMAGELSDLGHQMAEMPLEPELSKVLLSAYKHQCSNEIISIAALLSAGGNVFLRPVDKKDQADQAKSKFSHPDGDHGTLLNAYHAYKQNGDDQYWCSANFINGRAMRAADNVRTQLERIMLKLQQPLESVDYNDPSHFDNIARCLCEGYFMQVALAERVAYLTVRDEQLVQLHPSSVLVKSKSKWILFNEFVLTTKNFVRTVTAVKPEWLVDIAPKYYDPNEMPERSPMRSAIEQIIRRRRQRERAVTGDDVDQPNRSRSRQSGGSYNDVRYR